MVRFLFLILLAAASVVQAAESDPLQSPMWDYTREQFIGSAPYRFDERIKVSLPTFAENPTQVPLQIDATALAGDIERIVVWADLNPIQHIFTYFPHPDVIPKVSLRFKVQQGTAVRAAVLTQSGVWHVGFSYLDAAGGGCTTPSTGNASPYWENHLGETQSRVFPLASDGGVRFKFKVIHPMDTGLADAIPEFYIQQVILRNAREEGLARLELSQPVAENPVISFDLRDGLSDKTSGYQLWMRDNNGNEFEKAL
ncbi:quinoprotein dehydrogenase-associated SoxYZ-like carrier [Amphritea japonica]|uniref:Sulfur-oxidizing protein SoxY n=1 Tax=Amphritea japonica ATCC BAA-1530 TaxID=1278309 RepID=A0A7R6P2Q9_9GAMM|nr:quinoprotein dehydrogenase-associated SoxYZ-like carrier [Amphritea japonica]BBB25909.1 sulfur-oxidizing protein SoxY [Amphritea japonica ATCC BAA-1530]